MQYLSIGSLFIGMYILNIIEYIYAINGSWYYLDLQGVMAYNTIIGVYKVGANGAWIR